MRERKKNWANEITMALKGHHTTKRLVNGKRREWIENSIDRKNHQELYFVPFYFSILSCPFLFRSWCTQFSNFLNFNRRSMTEGVTKNKHLSYEEGLDTWIIREVKWKENTSPFSSCSFFFLLQRSKKSTLKVIEVHNTEKLLFKCRNTDKDWQELYKILEWRRRPETWTHKFTLQTSKEHT